MGENDNNQGNNGGNKPPKNKQTLLILVIATLVTMLMVSYMRSSITAGTNKKISYDEFITTAKKMDLGKLKSNFENISNTRTSKFYTNMGAF